MAVVEGRASSSNSGDERRAQISAAFEKAEKSSEAVDDAPEPAADVSATSDDVAAAKADQPDIGKSEPAIPKAEDKSKPAVVATPDAKDPAKPQKSLVKAPNSWTVGARDKWATIPPEAQKEILRREAQIGAALNQADVAKRQVAEAQRPIAELQKTLSPYQGMFQALNTTPVKAIQSTMEVMKTLYYAPSQHKAQLLAQMVNQFQVPIDQLAAALEGKGAQPAAPQRQAQPMLDPRVDQLSQQLRQFQQAQQQERQQRQQQILSQGEAETTAWEQSEDREFFTESIREDMADFLERAAARGKHMDLDEAYRLACLADPEVAPLMEQRKEAERVKAKAAEASKARAAGASVRSRPRAVSPNAAEAPTSRREALMQAFEQHTASR